EELDRIVHALRERRHRHLKAAGRELLREWQRDVVVVDPSTRHLAFDRGNNLAHRHGLARDVVDGCALGGRPGRVDKGTRRVRRIRERRTARPRDRVWLAADGGSHRERWPGRHAGVAPGPVDDVWPEADTRQAVL